MNEKLVYLLINPAWKDWIKVGVASSHKARLSTYQTGSPFRDYKIVGGITTTQWKQVESAMHKNFPSAHEWIEATIEEAQSKLKHFIQYYEQKATESDSITSCSAKGGPTDIWTTSTTIPGDPIFGATSGDDINYFEEYPRVRSLSTACTGNCRSIYPGDIRINCDCTT